MKKIQIKVEGIGAGLLMHRFPVTEEDVTIKARNRKRTEDDVNSYLYLDEKNRLVQPAIHFIAAMKRAGAKFQIPGQGKSTYKNLIGSGVVTIEPDMILHESQVWEPNRQAVSVQQSRVVRTRPLLKKWLLSFTIVYDEGEIKKDVIKEILDYAGRRVGIGDFRPEKGGSFGKFFVSKFKEL